MPANAMSCSREKNEKRDEAATLSLMFVFLRCKKNIFYSNKSQDGSAEREYQYQRDKNTYDGDLHDMPSAVRIGLVFLSSSAESMSHAIGKAKSKTLTDHVHK